jgi:hypothetical protein
LKWSMRSRLQKEWKRVGGDGIQRPWKSIGSCERAYEKVPPKRVLFCTAVALCHFKTRSRSIAPVLPLLLRTAHLDAFDILFNAYGIAVKTIYCCLPWETPSLPAGLF